ncbi:MAG TPA: nucleotide exchange factor GrpE [bacterium]|nr:nucleotide exchange factor GrpE [bacterium]
MSESPSPVSEETPVVENTTANETVASASEDLDAMEKPAEEQAKTETPDYETQIAALKDQLVRALADHDNFRKRKAKEFQELILTANERLLTDILPVLDDMERAMKAAKDVPTDDPKVQQFVQGFEFIYKKTMKILTEKGLKPMESVGKILDPNLHDALMQLDMPDKESHTIVDEHEKGYYLNDKVIRHAKVIVSKKPE